MARLSADLRVAWFSHSSGLGGAELGLFEAARALRRVRVDVSVVLPAEGPLHDRLVEAGIATIVAPYPWWMADQTGSRSIRRQHLAQLLRPSHLARLAAVMRDLRPDVVVTNTSTIVSGAMAAAFGRTPHVWYVREFGRDDYSLRFDVPERLAWRIIASSAAVVVNSEALRRFLARRGVVESVRVLPYAVDAPRFPDPRRPGRPFRLASLGAIRPSKGHEDAVAAVALLVDSGRDVVLRISGNDWQGHEDRLRGLARQLGVVSRVEVAGFSSNPLGLIEAADVVLVCSRSEAFGRTTIEALKSGRPVVGTSSGATPELIDPGQTGLLYPPGDTEALADRVAALYDDEELYSAIAAKAKAVADERFDFERYVEALRELLVSIAERRRSPG